MITGITALQGRATGLPHAVLFRAWDFQSPPPIAAEIMAAAQEADPSQSLSAARIGGSEDAEQLS
jgi:hypothetical protein